MTTRGREAPTATRATAPPGRARRGAALTPHPRRRRRPGCARLPGASSRTGPDGNWPPAHSVSFPAMNAFHVLGGLLALWALFVSFLGVMRENFPATKGAERLVASISILLVAAAISAAIITAANEEHEEPEGSGAALILPG